MILKDIRAFFFYLFSAAAVIPFLFGESAPKYSQRIAFVNNALSYLGTPYRYAGHSSKGMDCSGFVFRNGADVLKLQMPRRSDALAEYAKRIADEEIQPGDLLFPTSEFISAQENLFIRHRTVPILALSFQIFKNRTGKKHIALRAVL